jgi:hypothetical protein
MVEVVVHGPASWNQVVDLDELPAPVPHLQFARGHRHVLGGTSAGKAAHLCELGVDIELHTVLGTDAAAAEIAQTLGRASVPVVATYVDGPSERHLNLMDPRGGRVSLYLDVPQVGSEHVAAAASAVRRAAGGARADVRTCLAAGAKQAARALGTHQLCPSLDRPVDPDPARPSEW